MILIRLILLFAVLAWTPLVHSQDEASETNSTASTESETQDENKEDSEDSESKTEEESQDAQATTPSPSAAGVEKIEVTGSYIKRIDLEGPSPLVTIDKEQFQVVGSQTVADVLKERSYFDGVDSEAFVNFHGQTQADTLILLNGLRLPKTAGSTAVNIDFIPNSAVERVEVLKDGASALYGSEAVAGVMNIVTKKDHDGASVDFRYTYPEIGKNQEANVVGSYGKNFSQGNILTVVQYRDTQPIVWDDVGAGVADPAVAGTPIGNPGNLQSGSNFFRSADCDPANINSARGYCGYDYLRFRNFSAGYDKQHLSALVTGRYEPSELLNLKSTLVYTRRSWTSLSNPSLLRMTVPQAVANGWAAGGRIVDQNGATASFTSDPTLLYSPQEELGLTTRERDVDAGILHLGADGYFGFTDTWTWDLSGAHGITQFRDEQVKGEANAAAIQTRINNNTFNPFKPVGQKDSLEAERINTWFEHVSSVTDLKLVTTGELFNWGSGPVSMALGTEAIWESFEFNYDPLSLAGVPIGGAETSQSGDRNIQSGFLELTAYPLTGWEVQLAARLDQYSDVGSTFNPKIATQYRLNPKMLIRTSYGTAFKAPDLLSVNQGTATGQDAFRDEFFCQQNGEGDPKCTNNLADVTTSGNRFLKPETAYHFNAGTVVQPLRDLTFTMDYWQATGEDGLSSISASQATQWQYRYGDQFINDLGIFITRDGSGDITNFILPVKINSGSFKVKGIDLSLDYDFTMDLPFIGKTKANFHSEHTQSLDQGSRDSRDTRFVYAYDISWKNTTSLALIKDKNLYRVAVRSAAGGDKDTDENVGIGRGTVPTFTVYDFHYQYTGDWGGKITFGVKNLLDSKLPANDLDGFYIVSSSNFNPAGRRYYIGYTHEF